MKRSIRRRSVAAIAALALFAASCGGDDTETDPDDTETEAEDNESEAEDSESAADAEGAEASDTETSGEAAGSVILGEVVPLSGFIAEYGQHQTSGANLAVDQVNAAGGLEIDGERYDVELRSYDDECEPTEAVTATNRLIDEGAVAIIGSVCSSNTLAMRPVTERAELVLITPASTAPNITEEGHPFMFRTLGHIGLMADALIPYGIDEVGASKVGIIAVNNDFGRSAVEFYGAKLEELGAEVSDAEYYEAGDVDFYTPLSRIEGENPDTLFIAGGAAEGAAIIRQMEERGLLDEWNILQHGLSTQEFAELAGEERVDGCCFGAVGFAVDELSEESRQFVTDNSDVFGEPANEVVVYAYDAAMAVMRAMEKAGTTTDTVAIRDALADLSADDYAPLNAVTLHDGKLFDDVGQLHPAYVIARWSGGEFEPVSAE